MLPQLRVLKQLQRHVLAANDQVHQASLNHKIRLRRLRKKHVVNTWLILGTVWSLTPVNQRSVKHASKDMQTR